MGGNCFQRLGDTGQADVAALQADESTRSRSLGPSLIRRKLWRVSLIRGRWGARGINGGAARARSNFCQLGLNYRGDGSKFSINHTSDFSSTTLTTISCPSGLTLAPLEMGSIFPGKIATEVTSFGAATLTLIISRLEDPAPRRAYTYFPSGDQPAGAKWSPDSNNVSEYGSSETIQRPPFFRFQPTAIFLPSG